MLDTNICIYIVRKKPSQVLARFNELQLGDVGMSVITYGELFTGVTKSQHADIARQKLQQIIELIPVQAMPEDTGQHYGAIRGQLEKIGRPIGNNDLWIAAHALVLDTILVSNNIGEFSRVPDLKLENWVMD